MTTYYRAGKIDPPYLGNSNTKQVHDRNNTSANCQISEITAEHRIYFDTLSEAKRAGYDPCAYCIGD